MVSYLVKHWSFFDGSYITHNSVRIIVSYGKVAEWSNAAGEIVGGLHGTSYIGGCSLAGALALGRMVGEQLAKNQAAP